MIRSCSRRALLRQALGGLAAGTVGLLAACRGETGTPTQSPTPALSSAAASPTIMPTAPQSGSPAPTSEPTAMTTPQVITPRTLRVRIALATEEAGILIAVEKGYFKDAGLQVEPITTVGTVGETIPLLASGQLDIASGAINAALVNARGQGIAVPIVAGEGALRRGYVYHAYAVTRGLYDSGEVQSFADLKGRTLAMPSDAGIDLLEVKLVLDAHGLTFDDVQFHLIRLPDMPAALQNGAVDAAELVEPYVTIASQQLNAAVPIVADDELIEIVGDNFPVSAIFYSPQIVNDRPLAVAWLAAYLKGVAFYNQAADDQQVRAEVVEILKKHTPLKDDALYAQMVWPGVSPDGQFDVARLEQVQELWLARGKIQQIVPVEQLVDFGFVEEAAAHV